MPNCLPQWLYYFTFLPATQENCCSMFSPAFGVSVLNFHYSSKFLVVSCCFNLQFPNDTWCGASFHMIIWHLCVFSLMKYAFRSFACFLIGLFVVLLLSSKESFCILDTSLFSDMCFANIFSRSVAYLFFFLLLVWLVLILGFNGCYSWKVNLITVHRSAWRKCTIDSAS